MQMIYLLHSTFDEELIDRLRRTIASPFRSEHDSSREGARTEPRAEGFAVDMTEEEVSADLHFGRAA